MTNETGKKHFLFSKELSFEHKPLESAIFSSFWPNFQKKKSGGN